MFVFHVRSISREFSIVTRYIAARENLVYINAVQDAAFNISNRPFYGIRRGAVSSLSMRISRDKAGVLSKSVMEVLKQTEQVEFVEDPNTIRQETRKVIEALLLHDVRLDQAARQKIESQKRTILEGSQEWEILYRKYYNEEVKKL